MSELDKLLAEPQERILLDFTPGGDITYTRTAREEKLAKICQEFSKDWRNSDENDGIQMWGEVQDAIVEAYSNASQKHGHIESLFAACSVALDFYKQKALANAEKIAGEK